MDNDTITPRTGHAGIVVPTEPFYGECDWCDLPGGGRFVVVPSAWVRVERDGGWMAMMHKACFVAMVEDAARYLSPKHRARIAAAIEEEG